MQCVLPHLGGFSFSLLTFQLAYRKVGGWVQIIIYPTVRQKSIFQLPRVLCTLVSEGQHTGSLVQRSKFTASKGAEGLVLVQLYLITLLFYLPPFSINFPLVLVTWNKATQTLFHSLFQLYLTW